MKGKTIQFPVLANTYLTNHLVQRHPSISRTKHEQATRQNVTNERPKTSGFICFYIALSVRCIMPNMLTAAFFQLDAVRPRRAP